MPQFKPFWWINLLSWMFTIQVVITRYHHAISFPNTQRTQIARKAIQFDGR